jgi:hypothetical protein
VPPLLQDLWIGELILFAAALMLIAIPVYGIQLHGRLRVGAGVAAVLGYLVCVGLSAGHFFMWQSLEQHAKTMHARSGSAVLPDDWGSNFTSEDRTKFSAAMARHAFTNWGEIAVYIDQTGKRRPYEPTKDDHQQRASWLAYLDSIDLAKNNFLIYALLWPFIPLMAIWFGLARFTQPLMRLLTRRFSKDRPQAAGR